MTFEARVKSLFENHEVSDYRECRSARQGWVEFHIGQCPTTYVGLGQLDGLAKLLGTGNIEVTGYELGRGHVMYVVAYNVKFPKRRRKS